jgi:Ser/Thr protein kinase RdoA (MazF antagonist)
MPVDLESIARHFRVYGDFVSARPYHSGHINDTYLVVLNRGGLPVSYIFQRINHHVFKNPPELMDNIIRVTGHIRAKLESAGVAAPSRRVLTVIPTKEQLSYYLDDGGNYWRAYVFITGAQTYNTPISNEQAFQAAHAFGQFQEMLIDLPDPPLHETIPDFHNAPVRFEEFRQALKTDRCSRAKIAGPEIDFLSQHAGLFDVLPGLIKKGKIPVRITHNDTKVNNVMLDEKTGEGICIIDLDTVMPGLTLYDFGDLARTTLSDAAEDEGDIRKVEINISRFEAILKGYLSAAGGFLNETEIAHLPTGAKMMTLLIGMRFLIDFLDGDHYFKIQREMHNLDRCRVQFKLVRSLSELEPELSALIRTIQKK